VATMPLMELNASSKDEVPRSCNCCRVTNPTLAGARLRFCVFLEAETTTSPEV
jgi:hypothetical protein